MALSMKARVESLEAFWKTACIYGCDRYTGAKPRPASQQHDMEGEGRRTDCQAASGAATPLHPSQAPEEPVR